MNRDRVFVPIGFGYPVTRCACGERVVRVEVEEFSVEEFSEDGNHWKSVLAEVEPGGEFSTRSDQDKEPGIWRRPHICELEGMEPGQDEAPAWMRRPSAVVACRACEQSIQFVPTGEGHATPTNLDGTPHWATCTDPDRFRRSKKPAPRRSTASNV